MKLQKLNTGAGKFGQYFICIPKDIMLRVKWEKGDEISMKEISGTQILLKKQEEDENNVGTTRQTEGIEGSIGQGTDSDDSGNNKGVTHDQGDDQGTQPL